MLALVELLCALETAGCDCSCELELVVSRVPSKSHCSLSALSSRLRRAELGFRASVALLYGLLGLAGPLQQALGYLAAMLAYLVFQVRN